MSAANPSERAGTKLQSELALSCLPSTALDPQRKLAWANSIGILFLAVGIFGARMSHISIRQPKPMVQPFVAIEEPLPPQTVTHVEVAQQEETTKSVETPVSQVVIVVPDSPVVEFSVPTVGTLVAPSTTGQAPSAEVQAVAAPLNKAPVAIRSTGTGGDRPQPPYPQMALELGQQGTVVMQMVADANGLVTSISVLKTSGSALLDRSTLDFVKRHWILPSGTAGRIFQAPIHYLIAP